MKLINGRITIGVTCDQRVYEYSQGKFINKNDVLIL